ncbi:hypothetical protein [Actinoplanes sp. L3-i22]|uniref:hypothetical protein n=1 Tax=Actinoplanes sp. L3-i22 TaxID=2836373 RepID=UPI001C7924B3|nr:hypothetical protein [Actinoplanes sp. L3-i22]BCY12694.1 hypothetical protein L3i22_077820 [Actinoplanes sp. L3-i22]
MTLTFGIYPGGLGVTDDDTVTHGPPEDPGKITAALGTLKPLLVRGYVHYDDATYRAGSPFVEAPPEPVRYATDGRRLDLVACFREPGTDLTGWLEFLREQLRLHGPRLASLQVTEEANHAGPGGDGRSPAVRDALVAGVIEAKREARRLALDVRIGCNSTLDFSPDQEFWTDLGKRGGDEFRAALDYAGLDFFPDVFRPLPADRLPAIVAGALRGFREQSLAAAGIPESVPIHVTEHGWGTGPDRSYPRQAEVLELVIGIVAENAKTLNIDTYEHFALRDADSDNPDPVFQLGLLRSDYTPKPAFETYRRLIAALG